MTYQKFITLPPMLSAQGTVRLPGSKSISNRMLLLSALSDGVTEIRDLLHSDDTEHMLTGLRTLGVTVDALGCNAYRVHGCAGNFPVKNAELFLGNAGTAFRPLTAALALAGGHYRLSGVQRMHERPIADLVDALRGLGADIRYLGMEGFPPLEIHPATVLNGNRIAVRGDVSSQFLSALLMALPLVRSATTVEVKGELISKPYVEITLAMMARFGVQVVRDGWSSFTIPADSKYVAPGLIYVEGDASSASYFLAAGAIGGGPVRVEGVGHDSIQGDVRFVEALQLMGARIAIGPDWMEARTPESGRMKGIDLDCNHIPDAAMTLAVCALFADGVTTLRNIASWRVKETDRIAAMAAELRKFGATVEEGADFIRIIPPQTSILASQSSIDTYDDHRMAMCFSLAAFSQTGASINDPQCVAKTFPDYFECFARVVKAVPVIAIDGPSASGKGTVAQLVAVQLGFHYLDSGALYRLLALAAKQHGVALDAEEQLADLAARMDIRFEGMDSWLDGVKVNDELRSEQSAVAASRVAILPSVRTALLDRQHTFRRAPGLVADGRDMASVVFPDAILKIFLTASAEVRAERRYKQLMEKGMGASISNLLENINARDERDSQRSVAPLQQMSGARLLDTTNLTIEQAVQEVLASYYSMH
ncbi:bifunctional 3-phosphoshikimate 1-carboxyvinyltransferase/cytidylate kinase [Candidatus Nitrotoga sp. BS]|uniref:bifunctional 3-phosphoshikimate 1-carboxyvinyltransferase/cytidylate kinase n=1 Tax=Candidatus Nitrotoga sp. BS TaxID=2890408 RepID=UPI0021115525|nr:bifunctional 3-phosphoshikimate 1-carboxyvinyltransferase/cytidylate kinase [Candidatus Nitrotoga sp. BS]